MSGITGLMYEYSTEPMNSDGDALKQACHLACIALSHQTTSVRNSREEQAIIMTNISRHLHTCTIITIHQTCIIIIKRKD